MMEGSRAQPRRCVSCPKTGKKRLALPSLVPRPKRPGNEASPFQNTQAILFIRTQDESCEMLK